MKKNNTAETTKKGQTANNIQTENTKKSKTPIGKVTLLKETEARKKAREEQYRTFRINALKRRCKRMGFSEEQTNQLIERLKKQMDEPKQYSILVMLNESDFAFMNEALAKAKIKYKYHYSTLFAIDGDQNILAKLREIAPTSAKIYPYAKKMESVIPKENPPEKKKRKTKAEKKAIATRAKIARKMKNLRFTKKKRIYLKTLLAAKKRQSGIVVHLTRKTSSEGSKTVKKAA